MRLRRAAHGAVQGFRWFTVQLASDGTHSLNLQNLPKGYAANTRILESYDPNGWCTRAFEGPERALAQPRVDLQAGRVRVPAIRALGV